MSTASAVRVAVLQADTGPIAVGLPGCTASGRRHAERSGVVGAAIALVAAARGREENGKMGGLGANVGGIDELAAERDELRRALGRGHDLNGLPNGELTRGEGE